MKLAAAFGLGLLACGNPAGPGAVGNQGGRTGNPAAIVFVAAAGGVMEVGCWDPAAGKITSTDACAERIAAVVDGRQALRGSDGHRYLVTGRHGDGCDASGEQQVVSIERDGGGTGEHAVTIAIAPADVDVHWTPFSYTRDADHNLVAPPQPAAVRERIAAIATADVRAREDGDPEATIAAADLRILQVVDHDLDGDGTRDTLLSIVVEGGSYAGYLWSGVVLLRGGDVARAVRLWQSDLERVVFDGGFDLDGDGRLELAYDGEYYEGAGVGIARLDGDALVFIGSYGCGA